MTIRDVLNSAFAYLFDMETAMNEMYEKMATADEEEMQYLMEETSTYQELLEHHDFYMIDAKVSEVGRALGLEDIGLDRTVRRSAYKGIDGKTSVRKTGYPAS